MIKSIFLSFLLLNTLNIFAGCCVSSEAREESNTENEHLISHEDKQVSLLKNYKSINPLGKIPKKCNSLHPYTNYSFVGGTNIHIGTIPGRSSKKDYFDLEDSLLTYKGKNYELKYCFKDKKISNKTGYEYTLSGTVAPYKISDTDTPDANPMEKHNSYRFNYYYILVFFNKSNGNRYIKYLSNDDYQLLLDTTEQLSW